MMNAGINDPSLMASLSFQPSHSHHLSWLFNVGYHMYTQFEAVVYTVGKKTVTMFGTFEKIGLAKIK